MNSFDPGDYILEPERSGVPAAALVGAEKVRPGRLELPPRLRRTRPSTLRVYQFRHRRVER
jgi:hypothetical protein